MHIIYAYIHVHSFIHLFICYKQLSPVPVLIIFIYRRVARLSGPELVVSRQAVYRQGGDYALWHKMDLICINFVSLSELISHHRCTIK